jgi:hypothetical protein
MNETPSKFSETPITELLNVLLTSRDALDELQDVEQFPQLLKWKSNA